MSTIEAAEKAIEVLYNMSDEQLLQELETCDSNITYAKYPELFIDKIIPDGVPCYHKGCLNHITHPCEGCGRIGGIIVDFPNNLRYNVRS